MRRAADYKEHIERRVTCTNCPFKYCIDCNHSGCPKCGTTEFYTTHTYNKEYTKADISTLNDVDLINDDVSTPEAAYDGPARSSQSWTIPVREIRALNANETYVFNPGGGGGIGSIGPIGGAGSAGPNLRQPTFIDQESTLHTATTEAIRELDDRATIGYVQSILSQSRDTTSDIPLATERSRTRTERAINNLRSITGNATF